MTLDYLIKLVAKEYCFGSQDLWIEKVRLFPKNEWITPTNKNSEDYTMLMDMAHHNWVSKKIEPIWQGDSYHGNRVSFFIKIDDK